MNYLTWTLLGIILSLFILLYMKMLKKHRYWADRSVAHIKPLPFIGNSLPQILRQVPIFDGVSHLYDKFPNEKVVGTYFLTKPVLLIRDPKIVERIFVKDFQHFVDHDKPQDDESELFNWTMFNMTGNKWRILRHKVLPTFTTGKLKEMYKLMLVSADQFIENIKNTDRDNCELITYIHSYTLDTLASLIFGIEINDTSLKSEFKRHIVSIGNGSVLNFILVLIRRQYPQLRGIIRANIMSQETQEFFKNIISDIFIKRKTSGFERNDYVQLLFRLKERRNFEIKLNDPDDEYLKMEDVPKTETLDLTDEILAAQAFQFLIAGFDTINANLLSTLSELAVNAEIQEKVREEVKCNVEKHGGYTYQALKDMTYLEQCIYEALRKYSVVPILSRICVKEYVLDQNLTIEKGTSVMVSVKGLHNDPNHFPDPEKFDPDRFSTDEHFKNFTFLPFGGGPRVCIALRYAMLEMKLGVAKTVERFSFKLNPKTKYPLEMDASGFLVFPKAVFFDFTEIM